jgi:hypothetical protein
MKKKKKTKSWIEAHTSIPKHSLWNDEGQQSQQSMSPPSLQR